VKNIAGAYVINEERLNSLSDEKFLEMRKKQYIPVIYSHLSSLSQIERLLTLKDKNLSSAATVAERFAEGALN
ncbi:MAG: SapC family protein, partial [Candidatus Cloacimonetes bacterium]|nr:SapC family protein [Candidatus Cloacimonadota bacterium]